ncbi:MAG: hypothetical protein EAZ34_10125 [Polaromonas sp.]|nr:MAG: hypothetical protein EAZ34_10125 [Polaromonas sp.]
MLEGAQLINVAYCTDDGLQKQCHFAMWAFILIASLGLRCTSKKSYRRICFALFWCIFDAFLTSDSMSDPTSDSGLALH